MKPAPSIRVRRVGNEPALAEALADVLLDCVEGGASIGFMDSLSRARAVAFWEGVMASAERGERILLIAEDAATNSVVGTVQVVLTMPDNQPHRADVAKMQVHRHARRRGVGAALLRAAEAAALEAGKTLLVLDTVSGSDAERMYARLGWQRCGTIPRYALWPQGGYCSTTVFYRDLTQTPGVDAQSPVSRTASDSSQSEGADGIEVIGIDHIYLSVSDLIRSEKFYDQVMGILGYRKNTFPNEGDLHVQYYNRHFGIVLRPAHHRQAVQSPLSPGLHHLCFRVEDMAAVNAIARRFADAGLNCSSPQLYPEYAPDYYAIFFADPDGIRLEVTNFRQERRNRHDDWENA